MCIDESLFHCDTVSALFSYTLLMDDMLKKKSLIATKFRCGLYILVSAKSGDICQHLPSMILPSELCCSIFRWRSPEDCDAPNLTFSGSNLGPTPRLSLKSLKE